MDCVFLVTVYSFLFVCVNYFIETFTMMKTAINVLLVGFVIGIVHLSVYVVAGDRCILSILCSLGNL